MGNLTSCRETVQSLYTKLKRRDGGHGPGVPISLGFVRKSCHSLELVLWMTTR